VKDISMDRKTLPRASTQVRAASFHLSKRNWVTELAITTSVFAVLFDHCTAANANEAAPPYPKMAALSQYLSPSEADEIVLAKSAAPPSLSNGAEIQVLGVHGYRTAVEGHNGFICMVWRSWSDDFRDKEFWNPTIRAPICLNPAAAKNGPPRIY
jgi:hypothetical protein